MEMFWFNLKTLLGLILPYQYCPVVVRKNRGRFLGYVTITLELGNGNYANSAEFSTRTVGVYT